MIGTSGDAEGHKEQNASRQGAEKLSMRAEVAMTARDPSPAAIAGVLRANG